MNFFVYGTLKIGGHFANNFNALRKKSRPAELVGYDMFGIGRKESAYFPGITPGEGKVLGEVHSYAEKDLDQVMAVMDSIEGYNLSDPRGSLYVRKKTSVVMEDGSKEEAWVYVYNWPIKDYYEKMETGVWNV